MEDVFKVQVLSDTPVLTNTCKQQGTKSSYLLILGSIIIYFHIIEYHTECQMLGKYDQISKYCSC